MPQPRDDLRSTLLSLLALLAWDASGWDLNVARWFGSSAGFALRDAWWTRHLLHDGGRMAAGALLIGLAVTAWQTKETSRPSRRERGCWLAAMLLCLLAVPLVKQLSTTSCPWDLLEFGGSAHHVSHWHWGRRDGGGGHCFPSGHAVAAFGFFGMHFLWREHDAGRARLWLVGTLAAGAVFGALQMVRGAHYLSHVLWAAWLCWALCAAAAAWRPQARMGSRTGATDEYPARL